MGSFSISIFNWIGLLIPIGVIYALYRILKKAPPQVMSVEENTANASVAAIPAVPGGEYGVDKLRWMASAGYILVLLDSFTAQLLDFYQFYFFGWQVCLLTLLPSVIFYFINKAHPLTVVRGHLQQAARYYGIYVGVSIVNGVLLSGIGTNLSLLLIGVGISIVMLGLLIWLGVRCAQGIIAAFKLS